MGALESGAMLYAAGLIEHEWGNYVMPSAMVRYHVEEVAQSGW